MEFKFLERFFGKKEKMVERPVPVPDVAPNVEPPSPQPSPEQGEGAGIGESKLAEACPYCNTKDFVKRGYRQKKLEKVQL